jgi:hypothetical protein
MVMSFVIRNLYIGSLEDADDVEAMKLKNITKLVSVGCSTSNTSCNVKILSFEDILDKPEQSIISILTETNEYIKNYIAEGSAILVSDSKELHFNPLKASITKRLHYSR